MLQLGGMTETLYRFFCLVFLEVVAMFTVLFSWMEKYSFKSMPASCLPAFGYQCLGREVGGPSKEGVLHYGHQKQQNELYFSVSSWNVFLMFACVSSAEVTSQVLN